MLRGKVTVSHVIGGDFTQDIISRVFTSIKGAEFFTIRKSGAFNILLSDLVPELERIDTVVVSTEDGASISVMNGKNVLYTEDCLFCAKTFSTPLPYDMTISGIHGADIIIILKNAPDLSNG